MRTTLSVGVLLALVFTMVGPAAAKVAIGRQIIVEVHAPGTAKGMKHGAVTFAWQIGKKKQVITALLTAHTELTRPGDKEREKIALKDLKPGMVAVMEIYGNRGEDDDWYIGMIHVLGQAEDADPELAKVLAPFHLHFPATVSKVGPAERKGDLGQVEVLWGKSPHILRITKGTQIVWQANDGKRTPATLDDVKTGADVWVRYLQPLAAGDPPVAPAMMIILPAPQKQ
jgi:hypothetical protein